MKSIAIITARSGSKGIKDKNIRLLNGKPLMAYSIEAALNSGVFDEVMVSTDSEKYAEIARQYGASVPFLRSAETSSDSADSIDVIKEVILNYRKLGMEFDSFCMLQPTSPFRDGEDLRKAYQYFEEHASVSVVSLCEVDYSIRWCNILPEDGSLNGFADASNYQRQLSGTYYRINGAMYFMYVDELFKDVSMYREGCYAYVMSKEHSIDIDSELDFAYSEFLLQKGIV